MRTSCCGEIASDMRGEILIVIGFLRPYKPLEIERHTYIDRNRAFIPNYGERYRYGERISTGFVESTVNQVISKRFCKRQQLQWTKRGAHLLLQTRVKTLNQELGAVFQRWYPDLQLEEEFLAA
jgi:hypothetical protein